MCGIAGLLSHGSTNLELIDRITDRLVHRGPDDGGSWIDPDARVALGSRRLAIVDLSQHGHQPMASADGRLVIAFNGEIYNHRELRAGLDAAGEAPAGGWRGHSDTETLLQLITARGLEPALAACVGMFAFALWDKTQRKLFLVRDRFGEKPLYYGWMGGDFLFASELKAFAPHPAFGQLEIDRDAVVALVERTYIPAPLSIYSSIFKLEPACILEVSPDALSHPRKTAPADCDNGGGLRLTRYWSYADVLGSGALDPVEDEAEALDMLEQMLASAIQGQSMADVPVGAFLSGGIDSSTIVALYQKYSPVPVRTFTIGFDEAGFNEAEAAKAVARHLGTVHDELYVTSAAARDVLPLLPDMYDEPFADSSQIPTYLVSRFARGQVTVALTGDGGDELFGGYARYTGAVSLWTSLRNMPWPARRAGAAALGAVPASLWNRAGRMAGRDPNARWGSRIEKALRIAGNARSFEEVYASTLHQWPYERSPVGAARSPKGRFPFTLGDDHPDILRAMHCDALAYLPDDILCKVDRASMAVSLETRLPFLDHRVAALAARLPLTMKVDRGKGKLIVRKLLARQMPRELSERPKSGFALPIGEWLKSSLRPWAEDLLDPQRMAQDGWFDADVVQRRWRDHLSGRRNATEAIWTILMFQSWLRARPVA